MKKIKILGDPNNQKFCSSDVIISNLNNAAKKLDIYSDDEYRVVYDCVGNHHGHNPDAMIIVYEMIFPRFILENSYPRPIFGVSRDNLNFILESGYPAGLSGYFPLGVNAQIWKYREKKTTDKFVLLGVGEANSRGGLELIVESFCEEFQNEKSIKLYLRDRTAHPTFKAWVQSKAFQYGVEILHDDRHLEDFEEEKKIYYSADAAICLNKSSTWNLRAIECMSSGTPLIVIPYSGPRDYTVDRLSALHVDFSLEFFTENDIIKADRIGLRNHLFHPSYCVKPPKWSIPKKQSVREKMREILEDKTLRDKISRLGSVEAQKFTWESGVSILQTLVDNMTS